MSKDIIGWVDTNTVGTSDMVVLPAGNRRRYLRFCNGSSSNSLWIMFGQVTGGQFGIHLTNIHTMEEITRDQIGGLIDTEIHAVAGAAGTQLTIFVGQDK